jgi:hypothetical protein
MDARGWPSVLGEELCSSEVLSCGNAVVFWIRHCCACTRSIRPRLSGGAGDSGQRPKARFVYFWISRLVSVIEERARKKGGAGDERRELMAMVYVSRKSVNFERIRRWQCCGSKD